MAHITPLAEYEISSLDTESLSSTSTPLSPITSPSSTVDNICKMIAPDLPAEQTTAIRHLLSSYGDIFDFNDRPLGQTSVVTHRINTGDASPIRRRPYRVSAAERTIIQKEVDKMMDKHIIEP